MKLFFSQNYKPKRNRLKGALHLDDWIRRLRYQLTAGAYSYWIHNIHWSMGQKLLWTPCPKKSTKKKSTKKFMPYSTPKKVHFIACQKCSTVSTFWSQSRRRTTCSSKVWKFLWIFLLCKVFVNLLTFLKFLKKIYFVYFYINVSHGPRGLHRNGKYGFPPAPVLSIILILFIQRCVALNSTINSVLFSVGSIFKGDDAFRISLKAY